MVEILQGLVTLGILFSIAYVVDAKIGKERTQEVLIHTLIIVFILILIAVFYGLIF